ncbi:conjugative transposon protein TraM [Pedobacter foliorum]|uniref:conjugative transposon protein TraM n=1 Tax=Pedobacter foliorum TaxID=2739058 RepID=UPI0015658AB9|nr:conjugative transposon protein TraM [Pedobacter foliorum]NRF41098.1 conjugative transposon protein TraM [Pedobacter foliorum]
MNPLHSSSEFLKKRRFYTFLPVVIAPFATLLFMLLGGGQGNANDKKVTFTGINTELPDAKNNTEKQLNKMSFYENATADSNRLAQQSKQGPYSEEYAPTAPKTYDQSSVYLEGNSPEPNERQIYQRLDQLNRILNQPEQKKPDPMLKSNSDPAAQEPPQIQQLKSMMSSMEEGKQEDPELSQLQQILEKIQEIQHPQSLTEQQKPAVPENPKKTYTAIPAMVAQNQKVKQGTVVALTLLDSVVLNGQYIPKGHQVYGSCEISNQRIRLHIKNIGLGYAIIPVDLLVYDLKDSMEGINAPEAITADALKEGSDNAIQGLQLMNMDQDLRTQIAGAGITTAKGLFGKKIKQVKAKLKAGYPVLLKNNQSY